MDSLFAQLLGGILAHGEEKHADDKCKKRRGKQLTLETTMKNPVVGLVNGWQFLFYHYEDGSIEAMHVHPHDPLEVYATQIKPGVVSKDRLLKLMGGDQIELQDLEDPDNRKCRFKLEGNTGLEGNAATTSMGWLTLPTDRLSEVEAVAVGLMFQARTVSDLRKDKIQRDIGDSVSGTGGFGGFSLGKRTRRDDDDESGGDAGKDVIFRRYGMVRPRKA